MICDSSLLFWPPKFIWPFCSSGRYAHWK